MKNIKLLIVGLVLFASSVAVANVRINTYRHQPCDSWSFKGTCNFYDSFGKIAAEGRSVQRALDLIYQRISDLELQMEVLVEENKELKEQLQSK